MTLRFLTSFGMTESYVIMEGVGGGGEESNRQTSRDPSLRSG